MTPEQLLEAGRAAVGMPGRAALLRLAGLLDAGCQSELELWEHLNVFNVPGLRHAKRHYVVDVRGQRDAALASVDWITLRYSHERLHVDIPGCRRDTLATLAARHAPWWLRGRTGQALFSRRSRFGVSRGTSVG